MLLTLSIIALFLGPLCYRMVERKPDLMGALDAFIFVAIGGLVVLHMLPSILEVGGWWSLLFLALGSSVPTLLEKAFHRIAKQAHAGAMLMAALGLGLHGMTDGAALAEVGELSNSHMLSLGVILHRLPVGLTIWWLLRPHFGVVMPALVLIGIGVSTVLGHSLAEGWLTHLHGHSVAWFEALVVGTILHVVFHRPYHRSHSHDEEDKLDWLQGIGSLVGVVVLMAMMLPYWAGAIEHDHHHEKVVSHASSSAHVLENLLDLSLLSAPWLLGAYLIAAMVNFWFPKPFASVSGPSMAQALKGALTGLPLPICVPNASKLYRMLIQQGAGPTYSIAFLIASPLLGIDAILLSWGLLGAEWALWRTAVVLVFALLMALLIGQWLLQTEQHRAPVGASSQGHLGHRLQNAIRHGYANLIDHTAPWVIAGLVVASLLPVIDDLSLLPLVPMILLLLLICVPLHLCATGMTPVLAVLLLNGLEPAVALVILLVGPAVNWTLIKLLNKLHGRSSAILMIGVLLSLATLFALFVPAMPPVELHLSHANEQGLLQQVSLVLLILLYAGSILRRGARAFVGELLPMRWVPHRH